MPRYHVKVLRDGSVDALQISAPDAAAVAAAAGVPPEWVLTAEPDASADFGATGATGGPFPLRLFSQDMATLLDAGIPLLEALRALREKEGKPQIAETLDALIARVTDGQALSAAFQADPAAFGALLPAVTAASERAGRLPATLREHAEYLAWTEALRARILAAATYPTLLLAVGAAVVGFLLVFVMPRFAGLLDGVQAEIPWGSRMLFAAGRSVSEHPAVALGLAVAVLLAGVAAAGSPGVRRQVLALAWRTPRLGAHLRSVALARLYRTLGMLAGAGVPVYQALQVAAPTLSATMQGALAVVTQQVAQGHRLSEALDRAGLAGPVSRRMVEVGERSGELAAMLEQTAAFHDEEIARFTDFITRALNPTLMLIMGVVIGGIIVLMYLPIFELVEQVH
jgi:general secretion pathway protein F